MSLLDFKEALCKDKENTNNRTLLLGNGFSIAQTEGAFSYTNLLAVSNIGDNDHIDNVFNELNTVDFEEVINKLEFASKVAKAYGKNQYKDELIDDANTVRNELIKAIRKVHPDNFEAIPHEEIISCVEFLKAFKKIFTLNYDLLLYWVSLKSQTFSDGFGLGIESHNFLGPFKEEANCNLYNLHGGLHLFVRKDRKIEKCIAKNDYIINVISQIILDDKRLPLFVAEGSTEEKINKIRSVPYLNNCYEKLYHLTGSLFVFGHSLSDNDTHIYDAIFDSNLENLYFCVFDHEQNFQNIKEKIAPFAERNERIVIDYINANEMNIWGK